MPRCQRTFRRLPGASKSAVGEADVGWACPWCADNPERYDPIRSTELIAYARFAEARGMADYGAPPDPRHPTRLFLGLWPECVFEPTERCYDIYLQRGSNDLQSRLQIGHEVFHRLCSLGRIFHWTHEMLACLQSVRLLDADGAGDYADLMRDQYRRNAASLTTAELIALDLSLPATVDRNAFYGRAFVLGEELRAVAGWAALCRLARTTTSGAPDVTAWLRTLPPAARVECVALMAGAT